MEKPSPVTEKSCCILDVHEANIPEALKKRKQWVCWKGEPTTEGKLTKVPKKPHRGHNASHSNPSHWDTYGSAIQAYRKNPDKYSGIGYVFSIDCPFAGVDLDNCRDPNTGRIELWAERILSELDSYAEVSPSATGIKVFVKARLPGRGRKKDQIEMYDRSRFFTVTGHTLNGRAEPEERQEVITKLYEKYFPPEDYSSQLLLSKNSDNPPEACALSPDSPPETTTMDEIKIDDVILKPNAEPPAELFATMMEVSPKFKATWMLQRNDLKKDKSQSAYDLALATLAAIDGWKAQEIADLIIAFRRNTGNQPKKSLRRDYMLTGPYALVPKALKDGQEQRDNPSRELVDQAVSESNVTLLFDNVDQFARVSHANYAKIRTELKEHFGNKLGLGIFDKAVNEARLKIERKKIKESEIPTVQINLRQHREVVYDACSALEAENSKRPEVFYRSGEIVTVTADERDRVVIGPVGEARMRLIISRCTDFVSETQSGFSPIIPPKEVIHSILSNKDLALPPLKHVTTTPIFTENGRIIDKAGYDKDSGVYFRPTNGIPTIPQKPSKEDGTRAAKFLADELFHDIPFEDRAEPGKRTDTNYWSASLANLMGLLITPVVRLLVRRVPIAVITAPTGGHAKTLITQIISIISTGKIPGMMGLSPNCRDEEVEKLIASSLRSGNQFTVLDNVEGRLRSPALCRAVTAEVFAARLLGTNTTLELPVTTTWVITGNNIVLTGDLLRRAYYVRLNAKMPNPHLRDNFKHNDLEKWVGTNRGELISALLTMVKAWSCAGMPSASKKFPKFGGFERWARVVGGILDFCGVNGFLDNLIQNLKDDEAEEWAEFLSVWFDEYQSYKDGKPTPVTVNELIESVADNKIYTLRRVLPLAISDYFDSPTIGFRRRVGIALSAKREVRFGKRSLYLKRIPRVDSRSGAPGWIVLEGNPKNE